VNITITTTSYRAGRLLSLTAGAVAIRPAGSAQASVVQWAQSIVTTAPAPARLTAPPQASPVHRAVSS
jgi:hypothetical protein